MKKAAFIAIFAITGCGINQSGNPQLQAAIAESQPTCIDTRQCEALWSAARNWITSNCPMKIQTITDSYIQTFNPLNSADISCSVSKDPLPNGGYSITLTVGCGNIFGCFPNPAETKLNFNQTLQRVASQFAPK